MNIEEMFLSLGERISGVTNDSRKVKPGCIYVAIRGSRDDGVDFVEEAVNRGAVAVVREGAAGGKTTGGLEVVVEDARQALAEISCKYYGSPADSMQMTGITGTNGKTTIAYLVHSIFQAADMNPGLMTTVEYRVGERVIPAVRTTLDAPDLQAMLAEMLKSGCKSVVMEVSSHAIDQKRVAFVDYDIAVFTNLSRDHLDYHGTMDEYFEAKKKLFLGLGRGAKSSVAIINADDSRGRELLACEDITAEKISYGLEETAEVTAAEIRLSAQGTGFVIQSPWGEASIQSNLLGRYNVSNMLAVASVCGAAGIDLDLIAEVLSSVANIPGRLEVIRADRGGFQVFVDYAHTDDALEKVLLTLREITENRLIVVFGCGGNRDRSKRPAMGKIAGSIADYTFLTSDNSRGEDPSVILDEIKSGFNGFCNYEIIEDRRDAIIKGVGMAQEGDVLLIAGKGHERFQEMLNTTVPFDDRQVAQEAIGE